MSNKHLLDQVVLMLRSRASGQDHPFPTQQKPHLHTNPNDPALFRDPNPAISET